MTAMRTLRRILGLGLPLVGIVIVFGAVLLPVGLYTQLLLASAGVLVIEAGVWKLANPLLPSERRFLLLRREVDAFIPLARELNRAALALKCEEPDAAARFEAARRELYHAVDRMTVVAGVEGDVIPAPAPVHR